MTANSAGALAILLLIACFGCAGPHADYIRGVREQASAVLADSAPTPEEDECRVGFGHEPENGIITVVSKNAAKAGLKRGDKLATFNGTDFVPRKEISLDEARAGDEVEILVYRYGKLRKLTATCLSHAEGYALEREMLAATARGDWNKCISVSYEVELPASSREEAIDMTIASICSIEARR